MNDHLEPQRETEPHQRDSVGPTPGRGLLAAVGALAEVEELDEILEEIQQQRRQAWDRAVSLE